MKKYNIPTLDPAEVPAETQFSIDVAIAGPEFKVRVSASGPYCIISKILQDLDKSIGDMS